MDITDLISAGHVIASAQIDDKAQRLHDLSERAGRVLEIEHQAILDALRSREMLGSTRVGHGIALPHARVAFPWTDGDADGRAFFRHPSDTTTPEAEKASGVVVSV